MKKNIIAFFVIISITLNISKADTTSVKVAWSIDKNKLCSELEIKIIVHDTANDDIIVNPFSKPLTPTLMQYFNEAKMKAQLIENIQKNNNLNIYVYHPAYIDSIFKLIDLEKNKNKGIEIYDKNNSQNAIQIGYNISTCTVVNKKLYSDVTINISVPLIIKSNCTLVIDELFFEIGDNNYKTNTLEITIEK